MQRYFDVVQTPTGDAISGALVSVFISGTTTLATLYVDNGVTLQANPVTTNSDGEYAFYAANGTYVLQITAANYTTETKPGVVLFDPSDSGASNNVQFLQAGTEAQVRSVQSKLRDVVSVKDFGAIGDGVADDTQAFQRAFNYVNTLGGGVVEIPPGTYRKGDAAGSRWIMYPNTTLAGHGDQSVIFFDDKDTVPRSGNDMLYVANGSNVNFENFKITGTALIYTNETNQKQCLTGEYLDGLRLINLTIEKVRYMATAFGYCKNVVMSGNRLDYVVRDGLRVVQGENVVITGNTLKRVADDAIAVHSLDAASVPGAATVITDNTLEACQGIKVLGAKNLVVRGNVIRRTLRNPIIVDIPNTGIEGNTPQFAIDVSGNIITDTFGLTVNGCIIIAQGIARSDGGLASFPGINSVPYPYDYLNNIDTGSPVVVGQWGIRCCDNIIARTLQDGVLYSSYGYGELFDRVTPNFFSDPTITSSYYQIHGIVIEAPATNVQIQGNNISGMGTGFSAVVLSIVGTSNVQDMASFTIQNNTFMDCPGAGVLCTSLGSGTGAKQLIIQNNTFDLDPYFRAASHNADNTFSTAFGVLGIQVSNTIGWMAGGNVFKNCGTTGLADAVLTESAPNIVYADFAGAGNNASNKGVRDLPPAVYNIIVPIDGDPTSSTFGQIANTVQMRSAAIPATGRYVAGHRVLKDAAVVAGSGGSQYVVTGWVRATTGSGHVLNTDWYEMRTLTGT